MVGLDEVEGTPGSHDYLYFLRVSDVISLAAQPTKEGLVVFQLHGSPLEEGMSSRSLFCFTVGYASSYFQLTEWLGAHLLVSSTALLSRSAG